MSLYKGTTLISGIVPDMANQSLSNLNSAGQDKFDAKVNKAGDTMTGELILKFSGLDLGTTVSANTYQGITILDTNGERVGRVEGFQKTDGSYGINIGTKVYGASTYPKIEVWVDTSDVAHSSFPKTTCCDGQWIKKGNTIFSQKSWAVGTNNQTYSLSSYLPNDGYPYEVYVSGDGNTGATSGSSISCGIGSSYVGTNVLYRCQTRSNSSVAGGGCTILPIGTDRNLNVQMVIGTAATGNTYLYVVAYRRIGTNS